MQKGGHTSCATRCLQLKWLVSVPFIHPKDFTIKELQSFINTYEVSWWKLLPSTYIWPITCFQCYTSLCSKERCVLGFLDIYVFVKWVGQFVCPYSHMPFWTSLAYLKSLFLFGSVPRLMLLAELHKK
jgi:hypothetical protein